MVRAMCEFDTTRLPIEMLPAFIRLRSHVFAINARITELYADEATGRPDEQRAAKARRYASLASAVRVREEAIGHFRSLEVLAREFGAAELPIGQRDFIAAYQPGAPPPELKEA